MMEVLGTPSSIIFVTFSSSLEIIHVFGQRPVQSQNILEQLQKRVSQILFY